MTLHPPRPDPKATARSQREQGVNMGVSKNNGTPQIINFNWVFCYFHHPFWGLISHKTTSYVLVETLQDFGTIQLACFKSLATSAKYPGFLTKPLTR